MNRNYHFMYIESYPFFYCKRTVEEKEKATTEGQDGTSSNNLTMSQSQLQKEAISVGEQPESPEPEPEPEPSKTMEDEDKAAEDEAVDGKVPAILQGNATDEVVAIINDEPEAAPEVVDVKRPAPEKEENEKLPVEQLFDEEAKSTANKGPVNTLASTPSKNALPQRTTAPHEEVKAKTSPSSEKLDSAKAPSRRAPTTTSAEPKTSPRPTDEEIETENKDLDEALNQDEDMVKTGEVTKDGGKDVASMKAVSKEENMEQQIRPLNVTALESAPKEPAKMIDQIMETKDDDEEKSKDADVSKAIPADTPVTAVKVQQPEPAKAMTNSQDEGENDLKPVQVTTPRRNKVSNYGEYRRAPSFWVVIDRKSSRSTTP